MQVDGVNRKQLIRLDELTSLIQLDRIHLGVTIFAPSEFQVSQRYCADVTKFSIVFVFGFDVAAVAVICV